MDNCIKFDQIKNNEPYLDLLLSDVSLQKIINSTWFENIDYFDKNYPLDFIRDPAGRFFELVLFKYFSGLYKLTPTNGIGPDFCFSFMEKKILIEAVNVTKGCGNDKLVEYARPATFDRNGKIYEQHPDKVINRTKYTQLRISNSLCEKVKKIKHQLDSGLINSDDIVVIAINCGNLDIEKFSLDQIPILVQTIFGIGNPAYSFFQDKPIGIPKVDKLEKQSGKQVDIGIFRNCDNRIPSGVLGCHVNFATGFDLQNTVIIPNPAATSHCPIQLISQFDAWILENDTLTNIKKSYIGG